MPEELNRRVEELAEEVHLLTLAIRRRTRWVWATIAAMVLVGAVAFGGAYALIDRNNHRWCGTLNILTDPTAPSPTTERGRNQLSQLETLRVAFNCSRSDTGGT